MRREDFVSPFGVAALTAAVLVLAPPSSAFGAASEWCATSGVLPSDQSIPEHRRFALGGEQSFVSLNGGVLEFDDTVVELSVSFSKADVEFPPDGEWRLQAALQMISHQRQAGWLDFGTQLGLHDGSRAVRFGVARDAIGFVDSPSTQWIENASFAMDTTDAVHVYRVVKTGAGGAAQVEVFVDDAPTPVLTVPHDALNPSGAMSVLLSSTSIIGTARFDVHCFTFNTQGTSLSPCPADLDGNGAVDFDDLLAILAAWGNAGGPEDLDGSGTVGFGDLLLVLAAWGPCA